VNYSPNIYIKILTDILIGICSQVVDVYNDIDWTFTQNTFSYYMHIAFMLYTTSYTLVTQCRQVVSIIMSSAVDHAHW
jgi:hypothetical protein